jgi:predicted metal-dependent phosphoesterase TrpH
MVYFKDNMIDLHSHTTESDGTLSPAELIRLACDLKLEALAITDHDTFAGFEQARPLAGELGLELIGGIEMSTKYEKRSVHLLGYFLGGEAGAGFREWILGLQASRHARNQELLETLKARGVEITPQELRERGGPLPGRPHIARLMVEKGYVSSLQQAFDDYLDESASCYVSRQEPSFAETVERIRSAGGVASLPHPGRVSRDAEKISETVRAMQKMGLSAIEVYHSDHSPAEVALYGGLATELGLAATGGSDFHGGAKPDIQLGTGKAGNLSIPYSLLERLRTPV